MVQIVITTKSGGKDGKATVTFDSYVGFKKIAKKLDVLSTYEFTMLDYERRVYDATTPDDWEKDSKSSPKSTATTVTLKKTMAIVKGWTGKMKHWDARQLHKIIVQAFPVVLIN